MLLDFDRHEHMDARMSPRRRCRQALLWLPPSDRAVVAILIVGIVVPLVRWPALGSSMLPFAALHATLLITFLALAAFLARALEPPGLQLLRPAATIAVIFTLYTSLGKLGVAAMPYAADATLSRIDTFLCHVDPSLWIQQFQSPRCVEFFSFFTPRSSRISTCRWR